MRTSDSTRHHHASQIGGVGGISSLFTTIALGCVAVVATSSTSGIAGGGFVASASSIFSSPSSFSRPINSVFAEMDADFIDPYYGDIQKTASFKKLQKDVQNMLSKKASDDSSPNPTQPANPVIAMVPSPISDCNFPADLQPPAGFKPTGCVSDFYVRWLGAQGVRVVPMSHLWPTEKKVALMNKVNGVIFLGGGIDHEEREYYVNNVSSILDYALARPGFLLWGTCQGFQVIGILLNQDFSVLTCDYEGVEPSMLPLEMTKYQPYSTLFGLEAAKIGIVHDIQNYNTTLNWHHCGIDPKNFKPKLADAKVISTNVDVNGKPFVSAYEIVDGGKNIFAVQYHPERPAMWFSNDIIGHTRVDIDIANYHARFIAQRLQMNSHSFETQDEVNKLAIENYPHMYQGWGNGFYWVDI